MRAIKPMFGEVWFLVLFLRKILRVTLLLKICLQTKPEKPLND